MKVKFGKACFCNNFPILFYFEGTESLESPSGENPAETRGTVGTRVGLSIISAVTCAHRATKRVLGSATRARQKWLIHTRSHCLRKKWERLLCQRSKPDKLLWPTRLSAWLTFHRFLNRSFIWRCLVEMKDGWVREKFMNYPWEYLEFEIWNSCLGLIKCYLILRIVGLFSSKDFFFYEWHAL